MLLNDSSLNMPFNLLLLRTGREPAAIPEPPPSGPPQSTTLAGVDRGAIDTEARHVQCCGGNRETDEDLYGST